MLVIESKIETDLTIEKNTLIKGQILGNVSVKSGVCLELQGLIIGNLIIEEHTEVFVHGTIHGNIENNGGTLHITGVVNGNILTPQEKVKVDYKARILGLLLNKKTV